jgi:hypothetical protein
LNLFERIREPFTAGVLLAVVLVIGGFITVGYAWRGAARTLLVPLQLPYAISGGFVAIGLVALGLAVARVQVDRLHDAQQKRSLDTMVREASELIALARARHASGRTTSRVSE